MEEGRRHTRRREKKKDEIKKEKDGRKSEKTGRKRNGERVRERHSEEN